MASSWMWGTVTQVTPLAVQLDGDSTALPIAPISLVYAGALTVGSRVRCELTAGRQVIIHGTSARLTGRGSSALRDATFGTPANDAQKAALANEHVLWFNTDLGWEESYYAVTSTAGLSVSGLIAGTASGWYPTGLGPEVVLEPTATFPGAAGAFIGGWNSTVRRRGGASWFTYTSTLIACVQAGIYDMHAWTTQQPGSGVTNFNARVVDSGGSTVIANRDGLAYPLQASLLTTVIGEFKSFPVAAGQQFGLFLYSGSATVHYTGSVAPELRGQMLVRYIRPPLVSE